jgi:hypothetical protein
VEQGIPRRRCARSTARWCWRRCTSTTRSSDDGTSPAWR